MKKKSKVKNKLKGKKTRKIGRNAGTGRFASKKEVEAHPETTVMETVKDGHGCDG